MSRNGSGRWLLLGLALIAPGFLAGPLWAAETQAPPFYTDKTNLLSYLDRKGRAHPIRKVQDWRKRREHILGNMQRVMGPLPETKEKAPLDVQVVETERLAKVTRKKITYVSGPNHRVPAYLVIPHDLKGRAPAMLCLHGTGGSKGRTAGLGADYPRYTLELAERGYVTIAPDYTLLGENMAEPADLGYVSGTMEGIWSHMRAVDLLQSLPEVDGERIGCVGVSLGGHNSLFAAVFDPRLKVIVCSSGFDSFLDYMGGNLTGWCQTRYMPRIASVYGKNPAALPFDFTEVLAALAPRALYVHAPMSDANFKVESVRRCLRSVAPVYELFGARDRLVAVYPEGEHGFPIEERLKAYAFIDQTLR